MKCDGQITKVRPQSECKYFQSKLEFLGHMITPSGICPTKQIVDVLQASVPANKSELKFFLGFITYNAKFIPSVASFTSTITTPAERFKLEMVYRVPRCF